MKERRSYFLVIQSSVFSLNSVISVSALWSTVVSSRCLQRRMNCFGALFSPRAGGYDGQALEHEVGNEAPKPELGEEQPPFLAP